MANTIKIKQSSVALKVPLAGDLEQGELALNTLDEKLYTKNSSGNVVELGNSDDKLPLTGGVVTGDITAPTFIGAFDGATETICKNVSGGTILKGTPVYQSGSFGNGMEVQPADASNSAMMPAIGVASTDLVDQEEGYIIHFGKFSGVDTSSFSEGDTMYVASGGGYTNTKPTGESVLVQNLGSVTKVHASNGGGIVMGPSRANATPNLNDGNIFIGNASNQATTASLDTEVGNLGYVKSGLVFTSSSTEPDSPNGGDTWYDPSEDIVYLWVGTKWMIISTVSGTSITTYSGGDANNPVYSDTLDGGDATTTAYTETIDGGLA